MKTRAYLWAMVLVGAAACAAPAEDSDESGAAVSGTPAAGLFAELESAGAEEFVPASYDDGISRKVGVFTWKRGTQTRTVTEVLTYVRSADNTYLSPTHVETTIDQSSRKMASSYDEWLAWRMTSVESRYKRALLAEYIAAPQSSLAPKGDGATEECTQARGRTFAGLEVHSQSAFTWSRGEKEPITICDYDGHHMIFLHPSGLRMSVSRQSDGTLTDSYTPAAP